MSEELKPDTMAAMGRAAVDHRVVLRMMFADGYKLAELEKYGYLARADRSLKRARELRVRDGLAPSFDM